MTRIEYMMDTRAKGPDSRHIARAGEISTGSLARLGFNDTTIRNCDKQELANITASQINGYLDTHTFAVRQNYDREAYRVPNNLLSILLTHQPLIHLRTDGSGQQNFFGWSAKPIGEAIASLDKYKIEQRPAIGLAHTALHETGHLLGAADQQEGETHCRQPECIMSQNTDTKRLTSRLHLARLTLKPFCQNCLNDISA